MLPYQLQQTGQSQPRRLERGSRDLINQKGVSTRKSNDSLYPNNSSLIGDFSIMATKESQITYQAHNARSLIKALGDRDKFLALRN